MEISESAAHAIIGARSAAALARLFATSKSVPALALTLTGGRVKVGRSELSLTVAVSEVGLTLAAAGCRFSVRI